MTCTGFAFFYVSLTCASPAAHTFCELYKPVMWSRHDTRGTKEQVDVLNRKWKRVCRK